MNNKITYRKEGDYLIPNLYIENNKNNNYSIGKYGRLRLNYLKEHKRVLYTELLLTGKLSKHLALIDEDAKKRVSDIVTKLAKAEGVNEDLKRTNQMEWVQAMNNIKNRAEETVLSELIYWQEVFQI